MHIEVSPTKGGQFKWHFISRNGKITANNELFPSRAHAIRAAKAVVNSVARKLVLMIKPPVVFKQARNGEITVIDFS